MNAGRRSKAWALAALWMALAWAATAEAQCAAEVENGYAHYGSSLVHYGIAGQGAPAVVLLHGWGGDTTSWGRQIPALSKSHRVLVVDLPGHGLSDAPKADYTLAYLAGGVLAAMDEAGVKRAVVVGHSLGGAVARRLALDHPERVSGIILVDAAILFRPEDPAERAKWARDNAAFAASLAGPGSAGKAAAFVDSLQGPTTPEDIKARVREKVAATPDHVRAGAMAGFVDPEAWDLRAVPVPTLAVYAFNPHEPPDLEARLRGLFPDLTYHLLTGVGHWYHQERPEPLNRWMLAFLARPELGGAAGR